MAAVLIFNAARGCAEKSFGSMFDLARSPAGARCSELCMVCNTLNRASARTCRCCAHRLTAFYTQVPCPPPVPRRPMRAAWPSWMAAVRSVRLPFFFHRPVAAAQLLP